ncbi:MAG: DUF2335 domain-containing protein [Elusimicrobiales bacterium]|nr:DUF2335 domain-containing protein [Elusimicrobiales bacterium]
MRDGEAKSNRVLIPQNATDYTAKIAASQPASPSTESVVVAKATMHCGPLPSPDTLKQYNLIVPGLAKMICTEFAKQSEHRRQLESKILPEQALQSKRGQWFAFIIALALIVCGTWCINKGHDWAGVAVITGTLASAVGTFVYGKRSQKEDLKQKNPD